MYRCMYGYIDTNADVDIDLAVSLTWGGPLKRSCGAPLKGFGVDVRQV